MDERTVRLGAQQRYGSWQRVEVQGAAVARGQPGQYLAVRCATAGSFDPLLRRPVYIAATDAAASSATLLLGADDPAVPFMAGLREGATLDVLGPLGKGWQLDPAVRTLALVGTAATAAPLFALAHAAVGRGVAVTLLLGALSRDDAPPPFLLPAAAEYNIAQSRAAESAAIALLDDTLLRWADMLAIALPQPYWSKLAQRVTQVRIRWSHGFAQVAALQPQTDLLACCTGVCGVCGVETRRAPRLACVDGPVFDLQELTR